MTIDLTRLDPRPAGFGQCGKCAYRDTGTPAICFSCFRDRCRAYIKAGCHDCGAPTLFFSVCGNPICNRDRWYDRNYTIAYREGVLELRMNAYKFGGARGWGLIFARVLLGFLSDHMSEFLNHDLIVSVPAYARRGAPAATDNARFVVTTAWKIDTHGWPFDIDSPPAIVKTRQTESMKRKTWPQREEIAVNELRAALSIPDVARTRDKRIIVFDDLYTTGHTLNEVARCLIERGGARGVTGISLARQVHR